MNTFSGQKCQNRNFCNLLSTSKMLRVFIRSTRTRTTSRLRNLGLTLGSGFFGILRFGSRQNPPREDYQQRTEEGGDKVFKGNLQLAEPEIDSEKLDKLATNGRADHADQQVCPATQALLFERNSTPRERAGETAYNNP